MKTKTKTLSIFDVDITLLNNFIRNIINNPSRPLLTIDLYTKKEIQQNKIDNHNTLINNKEFIFNDNSKMIIRLNSTYFERVKFSNEKHHLIIEIRINRDYKKLKFFDNRLSEVVAYLILNLDDETMELSVSDTTLFTHKQITKSKRLLTIETLKLLTTLYKQSRIPYSNEQWKQITKLVI